MKHYITDPPCAFIEAVVGGYSPIDKWTCHFARVAEKLRKEPWWGSTAFATAEGPRGWAPTVVEGEDLPGSWHQQLNGGARSWAEAHGEIPWRTLHVETTSPGG